MTTIIERESIEFVPVTVTLDNEPVQDGVTLALTPAGSRPTTFTDRYDLDDQIGILTPGDLTPGTYTVWYKITDNPEIPIGRAGQIYIR